MSVHRNLHCLTRGDEANRGSQFGRNKNKTGEAGVGARAGDITGFSTKSNGLTPLIQVLPSLKKQDEGKCKWCLEVVVVELTSDTLLDLALRLCGEWSVERGACNEVLKPILLILNQKQTKSSTPETAMGCVDE
ncbi:hypothetical protein PABG_11705 [Paracoccidioides brasiliensis Pb03]|nr:hypothetical protein PABG_11705 [Paracoccidioides brasiliensis Pb03]